MYVVVYGTLKKGHSNSRRLMNATFVDTCVVRGFKLFDSGFPVAAPDEQSLLKGEIWDIGDLETDDRAKATLVGLDSLEGCYNNDEQSMYHRHTVSAIADSGDIYVSHMYVGNGKFWRDFAGMREMDHVDGTYYWPRAA